MGFENSLFEFDRKIAAEHRTQNNFHLIGIDEAGRGPLAGPVVASAVLLFDGFQDRSLKDSKLCTPELREKLYRKLKKNACWGIGIVDAGTIDSINILKATHAAMHSALKDLLEKNPSLNPGLVIIDGNSSPSIPYSSRTIVQGDCKSASIAAAGIIAKVTRDRLMKTLDRQYPQYGFKRHKGYGTAHHLKMLKAYGPCPIHRRSFEPVSQCMA